MGPRQRPYLAENLVPVRLGGSYRNIDVDDDTNTVAIKLQKHKTSLHYLQDETADILPPNLQDFILAFFSPMTSKIFVAIPYRKTLIHRAGQKNLTGIWAKKIPEIKYLNQFHEKIGKKNS